MKARGRQLAWECDKNSKGNIIMAADFKVEGQFKDRSCQGNCLLHIATLCMNMTVVWIGCTWITWHSRMPLHQPHALLAPTDQCSKWWWGGAAASGEGPWQGGHRAQRWALLLCPRLIYLLLIYLFYYFSEGGGWTKGACKNSAVQRIGWQREMKLSITKLSSTGISLGGKSCAAGP